MFAADLYYKAENNYYRKFLTINKDYYTYGSINKTLNSVLTNLIEASSLINNDSLTLKLKTQKKLKYLFKDSLSFKYLKDRSNISLEQININFQNKWAEYPILREGNYQTGFYQTFDDFRNNVITKISVQLMYNPQDSIYILSTNKNDSILKYRLPWAVCDSSNLYIRLYKNAYLKLYKSYNTFYFNVPHTLPDMFALLSVEDTNAENNALNPNSGNLVADLAAIVISSIIDVAHKASKEKKIINEGFKNNFRHCFIDMYCGDIIY